MSLSKRCILEIAETSDKAERLSRGGAADRATALVLTQRVATLRQVGISSDEARELYADALCESLAPPKNAEPKDYRNRFDRYIAAKIDEVEFRDWLSGQQSITYTAGPAGGYFIPLAYDSTLREAMAQTDPVLSEDVCDFSMSENESLQPEQISGYDLSTVSASLVGETVQQAAQTIPAVLGATLQANKVFKCSFAASLESESDIPLFTEKITQAASVALARRIGLSVMTGRGGADVTGLVGSGVLTSTNNNGTSGKLTLADFNAIYFSVNRWHRNSPKCAWLMPDAVYKYIRNAVDNSGRPLLSVEHDGEVLLGKPVYVSPSLANAYSSLGITGALIFGDLSHLVIRASRPRISRATQLAGLNDIGGILRGECLFIARARCDAAVFDPSNGSNPPLTLATVN
jgi:HK97 family phage major capsid protein